MTAKTIGAISILFLLLPGTRVPAGQSAAPGNGAVLQRGTMPAEVVDETGRRVLVPAEVRRIVSLAPSLTETVYALEAQERLVGVTNFCDYPAAAQSKPRVGGPVNPNLEQVVSLHPDLVLATRQINRLETVEALTRLGLPVYATDPRSVEDVIRSAQRLGDVLGAAERGQRLASELRERLAEIGRRLANRPPRRILFVVWTDPLISVGKNTFLADALRRAGAESVVDTEQDWPRLSMEEVLRQNPEFLVFASAHAEDAEHTLEELRERPGWRSLDAVREHRVATVSEALARPAPRLIDAIQQLAEQLHPEAFGGVPPAKPDDRKEKKEKKRAAAVGVAPVFYSRLPSSFSPGGCPCVG